MSISKMERAGVETGVARFEDEAVGQKEKPSSFDSRRGVAGLFERVRDFDLAGEGFEECTTG